MVSLFANVNGVGVFQDDIIVTNKNHDYHIKNLNLVLSILENKLQSFLGGINYYDRFIKNMSTILNPLYNLLRLNSSWVSNRDSEKAFPKVKQYLKSAKILLHFNPRFEVRLTVDASSVGTLGLF